jgi:hypothetical protein
MCRRASAPAKKEYKPCMMYACTLFWINLHLGQYLNSCIFMAIHKTSTDWFWKKSNTTEDYGICMEGIGSGQVITERLEIIPT